ncbi:MAG TPA: JAB domain-containing protein [Syntrophorhabdaceae bacterium]|nr:JAB domain-containing protein [Syntrophorhabdaceae bacterium]
MVTGKKDINRKGVKVLLKIRDNKTEIVSPGSLVKLFRKILRSEHITDRDKEHCWIVGLTTRNTVKYIEMVSLGTLGASLVNPREVFRLAIMQAVANIIMVHNHPSGHPEPSEEDVSITHRIAEAGKIIGIEVLDHIIIGSRMYKSFRENGLM